jgi:hypothetical protein
MTSVNYSAIANSHTLQFTAACSESPQSSPVVAWRRMSTIISISLFTFLPTSDCPTTNSTLLTAVSILSHNGSCYSLYGLNTDRIENTVSRIFLLLRHVTVARTAYRKMIPICYELRSCCLATGVFAEPFLSNGCLCWFHSSCLDFQYASRHCSSEDRAPHNHRLESPKSCSYCGLFQWFHAVLSHSWLI